MKKFIYQVAGFEFVDSVAFGEAWKEAKRVATAYQTAIYRLVIKGDDVKKEVYYKSGCFNSVKFVTTDNVAIF